MQSVSDVSFLFLHPMIRTSFAQFDCCEYLLRFCDVKIRITFAGNINQASYLKGWGGWIDRVWVGLKTAGKIPWLIKLYALHVSEIWLPCDLPTCQLKDFIYQKKVICEYFTSNILDVCPNCYVICYIKNTVLVDS